MPCLTIVRIVTLLGMLWFGVMAGFFWAFSVVVMPGLDETDPLVAMGAMQAINDGVQNAMFTLGFFGAPIVCLVLAGRAMVRRTGLASILVVAASVPYLVGVFLVTVVVSVPLNDDLATYDPSVATNAAVMRDYINDWTVWNHLRTAAGIVAVSLLGISLVVHRNESPPHGTPA